MIPYDSRGKRPIIRGDQVYIRVGYVDHVLRDGRETTLGIYKSLCATCGAEFTFTAPKHLHGRSLNRRCSLHRRPGSPTTTFDERRAEASRRREVVRQAELDGLFD